MLPARTRLHDTLAGRDFDGGLGALLYAREYPGDIDGLMLLAPYLEEASLIAKIEVAGDVKHWNHTGRHAADVLPQLWSWLQGYDLSPGRVPTIYLGFGDRDFFAPANQRLAELLPANHVFLTVGGHNWPTWQRLREAFLGARGAAAVKEPARPEAVRKACPDPG